VVWVLSSILRQLLKKLRRRMDFLEYAVWAKKYAEKWRGKG